MKAVSALFMLLAATAEGHYRFARVIVDGKPESSDWLTVRRTNGTSRSDPVDFPKLHPDVPEVRCYQAEKNGPPNFTTIKAGSVLGFTSEPAIFHDGPVQFYMAKVPQGSSISTWDGDGQVWFKASYSGHTLDKYGLNWGMNGKTAVNFTIPKNTPSGDYLVRIEQVGFNTMFWPIAQLYISCAQVRITDGGNGTPGPLVAFPGAYKYEDPGLHLTDLQTSYTPPGPPVWDGK